MTAMMRVTIFVTALILLWLLTNVCAGMELSWVGVAVNA
jgi:hypothetical protein